MARVLKKLTINRKKWITRAFQCDDRFCALGFLDHALSRNSRDYSYTSTDGYDRLRAAGFDRHFQYAVYTTNDLYVGELREKNLTSIFAKQGIDLKFADELDGPLEAVFEDDEPKLPEVKALKLSDLESPSTENKTETGGRKLVVGQ